MKRMIATLTVATALAAAGWSTAYTQENPVKIALVHGLSGSPLEAYSKQTTNGFNLGLEYATKGTMEIKGKKIELIEKEMAAAARGKPAAIWAKMRKRTPTKPKPVLWLANTANGL